MTPYTDYEVRACDLVTEEAFVSLLPREDLRAFEWANKYFYLVPGSSHIEGRWETLPYQRDVIDLMCNDDVETLVFKKPRRIGYTKMLWAAQGYSLVHKRRNVVIYFPTDSDAARFTKDEVAPTLTFIKPLSENMIGDPEKSGRYNSLTKKCFRGATLDILGGKSPRNYRMITKDTAVMDEADGFDPGIGIEGSPDALARGRIEDSVNPKFILGSTLTTKGLSITEKAFDVCDLKLQRFLPCIHCGEFRPLTWSRMVFDYPDFDSVRYVCSECDGSMTYRDYPGMDAKGIWMSMAGERILQDGLLYNHRSEKIDWPRSVGIATWGAYSYFSSWARLVEEFIIADKESKKGEPAKLKTWTNQRLAETYEEIGEVIKTDGLLARREYYRAPVPMGVRVIVVSVDVQGDRLEIETIGYAENGESWGIEYLTIRGTPFESDVWSKMAEFFDRRWQHESGLMLAMHAMVVDSSAYTDHVYEFCAKNRHRKCYAIKGLGGRGVPLYTPARKVKRGPGRRTDLYVVGVDEGKERIFHCLDIEEPGANYMHFPLNYTEAYFMGLTAESKKKKYRNGLVVGYEWRKIRTRNEPFDIRVYSLAAVGIDTPVWSHIDKQITDAQLPAPKRSTYQPPIEAPPESTLFDVPPGWGFD